MQQLTLCLVLSFLLAGTVRTFASELQWLEYTPTGDALFDRYAVTVLAKFEEQARYSEQYTNILIDHYQLDRSDDKKLREALAKLLDNTNEEEDASLEALMNERGLPKNLFLGMNTSSEVRSWEPEFGSDPRYWQLLSWAEQSVHWDSEGKFLGFQDFRPEFYEPLVEAKLRGVADARTLLMLVPVYWVADEDYVENTLQWEADAKARAEEEATAAVAGGQPTPEPDDPEQYHSRETLQHSHQLALHIVQRLGLPNERDLYDLAVATNPDWAQVYYARAAHELEADDYPAVLADLEQGNAAPRNETLFSFPLSRIYAGLAAGKVTGNREIYGLLTTVGGGYESEDRFPSVGWRGSSVFDTLDVPTKVRLFDLALNGLRKLQTADPVSGAAVDSAPVMEILQLLQHFNKGLGPQLVPESEARLTQLIDRTRGLNKSLFDQWMAQSGDWPDMENYAAPLTAKEFIDGMRPLNEKWYNDLEAMYTMYQQQVVPYLTTINDFHFAELKFRND